MSFELAARIAQAVRDRGGRALIVGGWVRDRLLGRMSKDLDLEVYGVEPPALHSLLQQFGRVDTVGESFTVYKVGNVDVSLPRRESKIARGHRGFAVTGDPRMTVEEASRRRDFTINAIAFDPLTEEIIDPYGGRHDLERRILRAVDPATFPEDSLRVLRALQFAARFDCDIEPATRALCAAIPLDDLPAERIWIEVEKLLLQARRPSTGLRLGLEIGVMARLFPELQALVGCEQEPEWHPEGDVWVHTLLVVDEARKRVDGLSHAHAVTVMLGALLHDLGKPATTAVIDGRLRSLNHEPEGVAPAAAVLDRLKIFTLDGFDVRRHVLGIVAHHLKPGMFHRSREVVGDSAFRRLAQKVDLELLAIVAKADCEGRGGGFDCSAMDWFLERARALGVQHQPPRPLLLGRHVLELGLPPGPKVGRVLKAVYEKQLDGDVTTLHDAVALARQIIQGSDFRSEDSRHRAGGPRGSE